MPNPSRVSAGLRTASPNTFGLIRMRDVGGTSGFVVTDHNQFRLTFAGATMKVGCQSCGIFISEDIASGTLNGSFDLGTGNCNAVLGSTALMTSFCGGGAGLSSGFQLLFGNSIQIPGKGIVVAGSHSFSGYLFYQEFQLCDFQDGMVLSNAITAGLSGCYTPAPGPPMFSQGVILAAGGTCTITSLPCV